MIGKVEFGIDGDRRILASPNDYEQFLTNNAIWLDIKGFIDDRLQDITNDMIAEEDAKNLRMLQSEARNLKFTLNLPAQLRDWSTEQYEQDQKNKEKEG